MLGLTPRSATGVRAPISPVSHERHACDGNAPASGLEATPGHRRNLLISQAFPVFPSAHRSALTAPFPGMSFAASPGRPRVSGTCRTRSPFAVGLPAACRGCV